MADRFDVAARRHLDTAEVLEDAGRIDDAGYHYGLVGETAVKHSIVLACGTLTPDLRRHFDQPLRDAIQTSSAIIAVLNSGRLGGGLARDLRASQFASRFDQWRVTIRYADSAVPVTGARLAVWKADAIALLNGGVY